MGLMDAFNPEATTEIKVGELYQMLQQAAADAQTTKFLLNGVKNEVPYKYIREIVTGEKEDDDKDPITLSMDEDTAAHLLEIFDGMLSKHIEEIKEPCEGCDHYDECHPQEESEADNYDIESGKRPEHLEDWNYDDLVELADALGIINPRLLTNEELIDRINEVEDEIEEDNKAAAGEEVTKEDIDFRPLPFPEVCKTPEEIERYHFLAGETKTELEHIAYELGILNGTQLTKETLLEYIITQERKAGGEL